MRRPVLVIVIPFFFEAGFSQKKIDFGKLPDRSSVPCMALIQWPVKDLIPIEKSKNSLEIRVHMATGFWPRYLIILSFDDNVWQLIKVNPAYDSVSKTVYDTLRNIPQDILERNFESLKRNKIFSLPGFYCLNLKGTVDDGIWGSIEIKAGDFFRQYDYNNPCSYISMNKEVEALKNLCNIIGLFNEMAYGKQSVNSKKTKRKHK